MDVLDRTTPNRTLSARLDAAQVAQVHISLRPGETITSFLQTCIAHELERRGSMRVREVTLAEVGQLSQSILDRCSMTQEITKKLDTKIDLILKELGLDL